MLKIGWFILIYVGVGWIIDLIITIGLIIIAAYKDEKHKDKTQCVKSLGDAVQRINIACADEDKVYDRKKGTSKFKSWLIGRLIWPISIPVGLNYLWNAIKDTESQKEEDV